MIVAIAGGVLAFWLFVIWRVKVEKGDVGVSEWKRFELRLRVAMTKATDSCQVFARALVQLAPAARRVNAVMRDLAVALERSARTGDSPEVWDSSRSPTSGATKTTGRDRP